MHRIRWLLLSVALLPACSRERTSHDGGRAIRPGASQSASLTDQDPRMRGNRGPYQVWNLRGKRGQRLTIEMASSAFDAYLFVRDADGFLLGQDDDGGDGNNARIRTILPRSGTYRIIATSFGQTARGDYTLSVSEWPAIEAPPAGREQTIAIGETKDGLLEPGDEFSGDGPYQDRWTFEAGANQRIRVEMKSTDVDAYLIVLGPDGQVVATNDDAEGRDAAVVIRSPTGGRYTALATTYGDVPKVGAYRIGVTAVTGEFAEPGLAQEITDGQTREGQLETGDSTSGSGGFVDVYTFRAPRAGVLTAELTSGEFDPYLTLQDSAGATLATDDDSGEGTNAMLTFVVTAGASYKVLAGTYGGGPRSGAYRLTVRLAQPQ